MQLTNLLKSSLDNPLAADCLARLEREGDFKYRGDFLIPLALAIGVYSARARGNADRGGRVEGYEHLMPALEAAAVLTVRLHTLEFCSHWFVAFTDESSAHLFGILKAPNQKDAWNDPVRGYDG